MIYAIYPYGFRKEALVALDLHLFWHLQISVTQFADFSDSFQPAVREFSGFSTISGKKERSGQEMSFSEIFYCFHRISSETVSLSLPIAVFV